MERPSEIFGNWKKKTQKLNLKRKKKKENSEDKARIKTYKEKHKL